MAKTKNIIYKDNAKNEFNEIYPEISFFKRLYLVYFKKIYNDPNMKIKEFQDTIYNEKNFSKKTPILLIHGFYATPVFMSIITDYLVEKGYLVFVPILQGHENNIFENIEKVNYEEWNKKIKESYDFLIKRYGVSPHIIGHSLGGTLSLNLAKNNKKIKSLTLISSPIAKPDSSTYFGKLYLVRKFIKKLLPSLERYIFQSNIQLLTKNYKYIDFERSKISSGLYSFSSNSVMQILCLCINLYKDLKNIKNHNINLIYAKDDEYIPEKMGKILEEELKNNNNVEFKTIKKGEGHVKMIIREKTEVNGKILDFLEKVEKNSE